MEIRIYKDLDLFSKGKYLYCVRVDIVDAFDFNSALSVFRSIYGSKVVISFVCV